MDYVRDIYSAAHAQKRPVVSFEFFPPKTPEGERTFLEKTLPAMAKLKPSFCSVTYGAGGSTREKTMEITDCIQRQHKLIAVHHLTCLMSTSGQLGQIVDTAAALGIGNILALRGDPPQGTPCDFTGGCGFARELVRFVHTRGGFCVGAAGFPEGHLACKEGKLADWQHLKEKIDAGVDFVLTQLFFENARFFEFYEHMTHKHNVSIPIVPGIMPIMSTSQIKHIANLCRVHFPPPLLSKLNELANNDDALMEFGIEYASRQCEELLKYGVPGLHLYTLNKLHPTRAIVKNLKLE